jgi:hypothetical protein
LEDGEKRKQAIEGKGMEYKTNQYMIYALNKMVAHPSNCVCTCDCVNGSKANLLEKKWVLR